MVRRRQRAASASSSRIRCSCGSSLDLECRDGTSTDVLLAVIKVLHFALKTGPGACATGPHVLRCKSSLARLALRHCVPLLPSPAAAGGCARNPRTRPVLYARGPL